MIKEIEPILSKVFPSINENSINLFLCGKQTSEEISIRKVLIEKYKAHKRVNIVLPEWIFHDLLDKPDTDLLTLENILANDVDKIILPIESYGTACELGAFSIVKETCDKLIVITESKYKNRPSFLRYGPMKLVKKSKGHLLFYKDDDIPALVDEVINKTIFVKYEPRSGYNIFNISLLIGLLLLIIRPVKKSFLKEILIDITKQNERIDAAIEISVQKEFLKINKIARHDSLIDLTDIGLDYYNRLMAMNGRERLVNELRAKNLWTKRKEQAKFRGDLEKAKLLDKTSE